MNILKINDGQSVKDIEYTEELANGMYKVSDTAAVTRNCAALQINIPIPTAADHVENRVSKIGQVGVLTLCGNDSSMQFFFTKDADIKDFGTMLGAMPEQSHQLFIMAFSAAVG
jgi:hypothetical protein